MPLTAAVVVMDVVTVDTAAGIAVARVAERSFAIFSQTRPKTEEQDRLGRPCALALD